MTIYIDRDAEIMKARAGEPWRPSNGHEGDLFMMAVCRRCKIDPHECDINIAAFCFRTSDPEYPKEWQIGPDGQPCCTAFVEAAAERELKE